MTKLRLIQTFFIFFLLAFSATTQANLEVYPTEEKYKERYPVEFNKFLEARKFLNDWNGEREKLEKSRKILSDLINEQSDFAPAHRELSRYYVNSSMRTTTEYSTEGLKKAEESALEAIKIEPKYGAAYKQLARVYLNANNLEKADVAIKNAEKYSKNDIWLSLQKAELYDKQSKFQDAVRIYENIIETEQDPDILVTAMNGLKNVLWYIRPQDLERMNELYQEIIVLEPTAWSYGNYASFLLYTYKDVDGSINYGRKAIGIMNYGLGRFNLATALYTKWAELYIVDGREQEANQYFEEALNLNYNIWDCLNQNMHYPHIRIINKAIVKALNNDPELSKKIN